MGALDELLQGTEPSALLTPDGAIRRMNAAMATALGRPGEKCVGRGFADLLPTASRTAAERLVANVVTTRRPAMRVLHFPGPGGAPIALLVEAERVEDPASDGQLLFVHALDTGNDLNSLLIPFRLAAEADNLSVWLYAPDEREMEWLGGGHPLAALSRENTLSLARVFRQVHPEDRKAWRQLARAASPESSWTKFRYHTEDDGWHHLAGQTRRIQLGYDGPERVLGLVRDDTKREKRRQRTLAALGAERQHATDIADFSSALVSAATEQQLQQVVLTRLAATFGATAALLALVDDGDLRLSSDAGLPQHDSDALRSLSLDDRRPLPYAIRTGKPLFIRNHEDYLRRWPQGAEMPWIEPDAAVLITPLGPAGEQAPGAWAVAYDEKHRPSPNEQAHVVTLADLAGQALRRIRSQQARLELATALQKSMLPSVPTHFLGLEVATRYQPSRDGLDVGGDWYDAFVCDDGTVTLEIGDAQGHDVEAAAFMGQVRMSMRAIAAHEPHPATVLARTNELLIATEAARFASSTMLRVDPHDGRVTAACAGHVPLLLCHPEGNHDVRELPAGPVLGVLPDAEYPEDTFELKWGCALVMVTDGVVEGPGLTLDAGLEQAGALAAQALQDGLSTEEMADRVLSAAATVDHLDDAAVLVIRRTR